MTSEEREALIDEMARAIAPSYFKVYTKRSGYATKHSGKVEGWRALKSRDRAEKMVNLVLKKLGVE